MPDLLWRAAEACLRRSVPATVVEPILGDLEEEYAECVDARGRMRAALWLLGETRSLAHAYGADRGRRSAVATGFGLRTTTDDARHALRRLRRAPGSASICAALLAIGIGLFTTMFSVVDSAVLRPIPFPGADRLLQQTFWRSEPDVMDAWRSTNLFEGVEAARLAAVQWDGASGSPWDGALVTPGMFELLGVRPVRGRTFAAASDAGGPDEIIVSESIWRAALGGDPGAIGRRLRIDGRDLTLVGVMPDTFRFPSPWTIAWRPLDLSGARSVTTIYGLLTPGVSGPAISERLTAIAAQHAYIAPNFRGTPDISFTIAPEVSANTRRALWTLLGGVVLVFIVLAANVSSLLMARLAARGKELATCAAIGASRARLMRQAVIEHALIAAAGIAGGIALAHVLIAAIPVFFLNHTLNVVDVDVRSLVATAAAGLAATLVAGVVPAWRGTRQHPAEAFQRSHGARHTRALPFVADALLITQVALASALLIGSGVLIQSFVNILRTDRGLRTEGVLRVRVTNMDDAFPSATAMRGALAQIEARMAARPEIARLALSREIPPLLDGSGSSDVRIDGLNGYRVGQGFFDLYGIPFHRGRTFEPSAAEPEIIVGARLAQRLWPNADPIGQRFEMHRAQWRRVVGVVGEITVPGLDPRRDLPEFYLPLGDTSRTLYLNMRCRGTCPPESSLDADLRQLHPALRARTVPAGDVAFDRELRLPNALAQVAGVFAAVALLTAGGGLYSVLTYAVGRRRREFGIRQALGAEPRQLRRLVFRDGFAIIAPGLVLGVAAGWVIARALTSLHYGVALGHPLAWIAVCALVGVTSFVAMWHPSRQAMTAGLVALMREE